MIDFTNLKKHFSHDIRKTFANKFIAVLLLLISYLFFVSWRFGVKDGFLVTTLTWSFFVLATPIPDGGIILDLPIRYFTNIKMIISEIFVWIVAIVLNVITLLFNSKIYEKTMLLQLFKNILIETFPYSTIIILSCLGTFFTLYVTDDVYDQISYKKSKLHQKHNKKIKYIFLISFIVLIIFLYKLLLKNLGVNFI